MRVIPGQTCNRLWIYVTSITHLETKEQQFTEESFSWIVDYFHFENRKEILDW